MTERTNSQPTRDSASVWILRRVGAAEDGARLDVFLAGQPEVDGRAAAKALIQVGRAEVEGRVGKPGHPVATGQLVRFSLLDPDERPCRVEPAPVAEPTILFEDAFILVIDKPAGLVVHPPSARAGSRGSRSAAAPSVATWAESHSPGLPRTGGDDRPGIVHRLDKETSGVMVVAKTEDAFHFLKGEFRARRVQKEYRAIAFGEARFDSDHIDRNIGSHPTKGDRVVVVKDGGREASTYYEVVERFRGFTHFLCRPRTGRTHQIRVHMTSVGHGLVGDRFYRSRNHANAAVPGGAPDPGRHCLHARRLEFRHPHSHETVSFEANVPDDFAALLEWLRANRPLDARSGH